VSIRDFITIAVAITLTLFLVNTQIDFLVNRLFLQLQLAIIFIVAFRSKSSLLFTLIYLFIYDVFAGVNPAASILVIGSSGIITYVVDNFFDLFKQQPFWTGKVTWILLASSLYAIFLYEFNFSLVISNLLAIIIVNLIGMFFLNLIFSYLITTTANAEISVS
jgi:hypothetical protein